MERKCEQKLEGKPGGGEKTCGEKAQWKVSWPGTTPLDMCSVHARQAQKVGSAIGCHIPVEEIPS